MEEFLSSKKKEMSRASRDGKFVSSTYNSIPYKIQPSAWYIRFVEEMCPVTSLLTMCRGEAQPAGICD